MIKKCQYCGTPFDVDVVIDHENKCIFGKPIPEPPIPQLPNEVEENK